MDKIVKNEFYFDNTPIPFCHGCLSTDRTLLILSEYVDVFYKICEYQNVAQPTGIQLCWECMAFLKRVNNFSKKVNEAQRLLKYCLNKQATFPHSLTSLKTAQINTNPIILSHEDIDVKQVKIETQFDDDSDSFNYSTDDVKEELDKKPKLDNVTESTKEDTDKNDSKLTSDEKRKEFSSKLIKKRRAKYRYVNTNLRKHRSYLIETLPVEESEVLPALEMERNNKDFLKARHKCVNCIEQFSDEIGLTKHLKTHHDDVSKTDRTFYYLYCKVRHFYDHYRSLHKACICDVCGKSCGSKKLIERHLKYHFGYPCPHCKKVLKNSTSYKTHIECLHNETYSDDAYCVSCDLRFKNVMLYKRHLQTGAAHARERVYDRYKRKFPCPDCGKVYSRKTYMNNHYRHVHTKDSKYKCEDCDQHFLNRTKYLYHRRFKHEGAQKEKDKQCNICGRGFSENSTLINHIRTHSGERPFGCEYCGAKFTQKYAMLSHVKFIHLKNRRKPCS